MPDFRAPDCISVLREKRPNYPLCWPGLRWAGGRLATEKWQDAYTMTEKLAFNRVPLAKAGGEDRGRRTIVRRRPASNAEVCALFRFSKTAPNCGS